MAAGWGNLVDLEARLERIRSAAHLPRFRTAGGQLCKRIRNILDQA